MESQPTRKGPENEPVVSRLNLIGKQQPSQITGSVVTGYPDQLVGKGYERTDIGHFLSVWEKVVDAAGVPCTIKIYYDSQQPKPVQRPDVLGGAGMITTHFFVDVSTPCATQPDYKGILEGEVGEFFDVVPRPKPEER